MERPLYTPPIKPRIESQALEDGDTDVDAGALFGQVVVDRERLAGWIRQVLQERSQASLAEIVERHPLELGLAELVAYLSLASESGRASFDDNVAETVHWIDALGKTRQATLPRVIFVV
jgi:hypothetical protein